jgi:predicted RNA-binding protein Jag
MKSIVEEASSILKAIEKGWSLAGKPQEFSIKIFEVEQKNFLGMTTKPAKIAIFFGEKNGERTSYRAEHQDKRASLKKEVRPNNRRQLETTPPPRPPRISEEKREIVRTEAPRELWTADMTQAAQAWLQETLRLMKLSGKKFTVETKNYYLKISFDQPLFDNTERERVLFRNFAYLLMQSLRNKFKKGLRGFKIILTSKAS